tara:strand:- start:1987 stop:3801 length:1815 start_codon:yes stop_codon:yes gene_type:complete
MKNNAYQILNKTVSILSKKEKSRLFILILFSFVSSTLEFVSVISVYPFINIILDKNTIYSNNTYFNIWQFFGSPSIESFIFSLSLVISFIILISSSFNFYTQYLCNMFASDIQINLGTTLFRNLAYADYEWHLSKNSIRLMNLFTTNLSKLTRNIIRQIPLLFGYVSTLIIPIISLLILSPKYSLLLIFAFSFILFYFLRLIRKKTSYLSKGTRLKLDELNILLVESIQGIKDVKLSSKEDDFKLKFQNIYSQYCTNISITENFNQIPLNLVLMLSQLIIVCLGTVLFLSDISTSNLVGIMTIVALIAFKIIPALNKLGNSLNRISESYIFSKVVNDINSDLEAQIYKNNYSKRKKINTKSKWDKVIFKDVFYKYPESDSYAIQKINLEIKKGLHYGFVGYSGSGKSTTIDLFNGLLSPKKGNIYIDELPIKDYGLRKWQKKIGYVPQQPKISDQSILENIGFGLDESKIDIKRVQNCIDLVGLYDFINTLPNGLNTILGDRGKFLSGGQQQLVAIARALYKKPEVIILDEATSALDSISKNLVKDALNRLHGKITLLTIAHQFSNIKEADHIFLFEKGSLINQGDFNYLENNSILFKKFIRNN